MLQKVLIPVICLWLTACSDESMTSAPQDKVAINKPDWPAAQLQQGRQLYLQNCAVCHGMQAEGATHWQKRDAQGKWLAPPLNGTGHAWHHPMQALEYTIKNGTARLGGNMPAWKDRLTEQQIAAIIAWFQSQWPDELYAAWYKLDQEARTTQQP